MSNLIHECHRNIIKALRIYLSKCQYIINTFYQKLYIWHSHPLPTWPSLWERKLKDRKVIFPYLVCIQVDLVPEQIVFSIRRGKDRKDLQPPELMLSRCRHRAGGVLTTARRKGTRSLGCLTPLVQSRQQRCGVSSAFRGAAKTQYGLDKGWVSAVSKEKRTQIKMDSTWTWAIICYVISEVWYSSAWASYLREVI